MELEPADEVIVTAIVENTANKPGFYAEHGLSMFIEIISEDKTTKILMDAGQSTFAFLNNAQRLIDLTEIDAIVISHGHFDHTGALLDVLKKIPRQIPIIGHPNMFDKKYAKHARLRYIGVSFSKEDLQHAGILTLTKTPVKVAPSACTTGEINRTSYLPLSNKLLTKNDDDMLVKDKLLDDQALIVNMKEGGLVIISGCAHSGIVNTIFHAQKLINRQKIMGVIGGFHLFESDPVSILAVLEVLKSLNPKILAPCHCTGFLAQKIFSDNLEGFKLFNTGTILKL